MKQMENNNNLESRCVCVRTRTRTRTSAHSNNDVARKYLVETQLQANLTSQAKPSQANPFQTEVRTQK